MTPDPFARPAGAPAPQPARAAAAATPRRRRGTGVALVLLGLLTLAASCTPTQDSTTVTRAGRDTPPGSAPGTCWGKQISPAVIETVTNQIMVQPAEVLADGTVTRPAVFKTETRQQIVRPRQETWFEIPCDDQMTPEFIASVQRALAVRDLYRGQITGEMDRATRAAVRRYQKPEGLDSDILSLAAARQLGLIALPR